MAVGLSPVFNLPNIQDLDGNPASGFLIFAYEAGSNSVLKDTFTDEFGDVENSNPIVLDSSGNLPEAIWLTLGEAYNLVLTNPSGTTVIKNFDGVTAVPGSGGGGGSGGTSVWTLTNGATYLTPTSFQVPGNLAAEYKVGNRVRLLQGGGYIYGTVSGVNFVDPNTNVTILNDSAPINSSLATAEWSVLIASPGATVDAGGVSYFDAMPYDITNTVGWKIKTTATSTNASIASVESKRAAMQSVWTAVGTGSYVLTPNPAATSYTVDQIFMVKFIGANTIPPVINISNLGLKNLMSFNPDGGKIPAKIYANFVSQIAYDGVDFIVLDPPLPGVAGAIPHGVQTFAAPGTFTVPANVYNIKVTIVGGGGGGGAAGIIIPPGGEGPVPEIKGGQGGNGGMAIKYLNTTPGTQYAVTLGSPGGGSDFFNGSTGGTSSFGGNLAVATGGLGGVGANGGGQSAPGFGSSSDYGFSGSVLMFGNAAYGAGGLGATVFTAFGSPGTPGAAIVEW